MEDNQTETAAASFRIIEEEEVKVKLSGKKKRAIRMIRGAAGIRAKPPKPFLPENGLSIIERYFHHMPPKSAQVILTYGGRIIMPKGALHLSVDRLLDVLKVTSAEIFRTASVLDYDTQIFSPMGKTAADLKIPYKFTVLEDESTFATVAQQELNQKYDTKDPTKPLWSIHFVGPKAMQGEGIKAPKGDPDFAFPKFYVFFSFHHCICDGLSGWCFIRLFMTKMGPESFQESKINLDVPVTSIPPPLIDNLITSNCIELLPAYVDAIVQLITKRIQKKSRLKNLCIERFPVDFPTILNVEPRTATNVKFFSFDEEFSESLRLKCRNNKTTIASAVIVAALAAARAVFVPRAEKQNKKIPSHQAWVVTSSTRHLIPNSRLMEGADKEKDPALMAFGGYGGSITNERFKIDQKSDLWGRSRAVKQRLAGSFLKSMRRMKLVNYLFRKHELWKKLQAKIDLQDITRTYSVEVANLGSWNNPYAPMETPRTDLADADWFAGSLNNSFHGARAVFTVALISINNVMSFTVAYDMATISPEEGNHFVTEISSALDQMKCSESKKCYLKNNI